MANTVLVKRNSTSGAVPAAGSLSVGELALNTADSKLYTKNTSGTVVQLNASSSGITRSVSSISAATTAGAATSTDYVYLVSGVTTLTLPTAVGNTNLYTVKRTGTGVVTVATTSSQTIDGSATVQINRQYESHDFISDGANWNIL